MKKLFTCLCLVVGLFALSGLALAQSVAGEWDATMETPGEPVNYKVVFKVDGEKLSGTVKRSSGEAALQGTVKGKEIKFSYAVNYNNNELVIGVTGTLEGNTIKGSVDIGGGAYQGAWLAKRVGSAAAATAQSAPASPSGADEWELTINSPQGSSNSILAYSKEGEAIKGTLRSERGQLPMQGTLKGNNITINFTIKFQDNDMPITLTGKVDGAAMKGEADFGGLAQGDWMAKRKAGGPAPVASSSTNQAINVTGSWVFEVETGQGNGSPSFTFKQEGEKLTGRYKGTFGEADLTGTVKGEQIEFSIKVTGQMEATIVYRGTTDGKTMKGKVALGELGEGTFTGKKQ